MMEATSVLDVLTPEERAKCDDDVVTFGRCVIFTSVDGKTKRIPPAEWAAYGAGRNAG